MNLRKTIKLALLGVLFGVAGNVSAGNDSYYSKATATVKSGNGKVYVNTSESESSANYDSSSSAQYDKTSSQSHKYYLFANPDAGNQFDGWYDDEACTNCISKDTKHIVEKTATATSSDSRNIYNFYAKFSEASTIYYSTVTVKASDSNCQVGVLNASTGTVSYDSEKTTSLSDTHASHTYYLYAKNNTTNDLDFYGWYADENLTQVISYQPNCIYEVSELSEDSSAPSQFTFYAKYGEPSKYQMRNSNFENWETVNKSEEPLQWSSFYDCTYTTLTSSARGLQIEKSTEAKKGKYSAYIYGREVMGIAIAQGNLTNGCINAGSMSAADASGNYNYVGNPKNTRSDQNMKFSGRPDAVKFWCKFSGDKDYGNASLILLTDGYYQDPEANTLTATKIAHAKNDTIASTGTWNEIKNRACRPLYK